MIFKQSNICGIRIILKVMVADKMEPQINADERRLNASSEEILWAAFEISNVLVAGFLEGIYENALNIKLNWRGLKTFQLAPMFKRSKNNRTETLSFAEFLQTGIGNQKNR